MKKYRTVIVLNENGFDPKEHDVEVETINDDDLPASFALKGGRYHRIGNSKFPPHLPLYLRDPA